MKKLIQKTFADSMWLLYIFFTDISFQLCPRSTWCEWGRRLAPQTFRGTYFLQNKDDWKRGCPAMLCPAKLCPTKSWPQCNLWLLMGLSAIDFTELEDTLMKITFCRTKVTGKEAVQPCYVKPCNDLNVTFGFLLTYLVVTLSQKTHWWKIIFLLNLIWEAGKYIWPF